MKYILFFLPITSKLHVGLCTWDWLLSMQKLWICALNFFKDSVQLSIMATNSASQNQCENCPVTLTSWKPMRKIMLNLSNDGGTYCNYARYHSTPPLNWERLQVPSSTACNMSDHMDSLLRISQWPKITVTCEANFSLTVAQPTARMQTINLIFLLNL